MKRYFAFLLLSASFLFFVACVSIPSSASSTGPRTLVLSGTTISEDQTDSGFISWYCVDFVYGGKVLVEVGSFSVKNTTYGFILYDGGYTGELTEFYRQGLNYRWDWGTINHYSFLIEPDGTALYYDFTGVPYGESTKAKGVYKAHRR